MFNWLFKKYLAQITPEQQLAKDVEDVVQAMKESLGEAGRWEVNVQSIEETYRAVRLNTYVEQIEVKEHLVVNMLDTRTGWEMSVKLKQSTPSYHDIGLCEVIDKKTKDVGIHRLNTTHEVDSVLVKNHSSYAFLPPKTQLRTLYHTWWQICVLPEIERQRVERKGKEMQIKLEGIGKLKALYGKEK